jgi:hypothetical protein
MHLLLQDCLCGEALLSDRYLTMQLMSDSAVGGKSDRVARCFVLYVDGDGAGVS